MYVLGVENNAITEKSKKYFASFAAHNIDLLTEMPCSEANAIISFLQSWNLDQALSNPVIQEALQNGLGHGNVTFRVDHKLAVKIPAISQGWNSYYCAALQSGPSGTCLVTGKTDTIARIHNSVKGIYAKALAPNGWTLVGFDAGSPAYNSYGKKQGYNAPVGEYAAFAYVAALNSLLADKNHKFQIGDTTVVCWAEGGEVTYQSVLGWTLFGAPSTYEEKDIRDMVKKLVTGNCVVFDETRLDPNKTFYILGLSPNAARLSVRFFLRNSFGAILENVQAHYERLEIVRPVYNESEPFPLWKLLRETVRDKGDTPNPVMSGETLRAVLMNTPYPAALINGVMLRIRADRNISWERAAILKAYLRKNYEHSSMYSTLLEVADVNLNENCRFQPYVLGRLFAVMERTQLASADWKLNRTIRDSYLNSAATTPKNIFSKLFPLSEYHMKKLTRDKPGLAQTLKAEKVSLVSMIDASIPARFTQDETNCFYVGYYHQTARYQKKEDTKNV
jgi:CRISPR-associated protein Csd1